MAQHKLEHYGPTVEQCLNAFEVESARLGRWETRTVIVNAALGIAIFMLMICLSSSDWNGYLLLAAALSIFGLVQAKRKARSGFERGMAAVFSHYRDVRFIGPALDLYRNEAETETLLAPILTDLLSRAAETDVHFVNTAQRQKLYEELERCGQYHHFAPEMILSGMRALVNEGDRSAVAVLENVARTARDHEIKDAARTHLLELKAKLSEGEMKQSLLRAAQVPVLQDDLLRPAAHNESMASELLRAGPIAPVEDDQP